MDSPDLLNASSITAAMSTVLMLNGTNFKTWKNKITMILGYMDIDLALREPFPLPLTDKSTQEYRLSAEKWKHSNRVSLMNVVPETFLNSVSEDVDSKTFLDTLEECFAKSKKSETSASLRKLVSMRYTGTGNLREYILEMLHLSTRLKTLKLEISEDLLVHLVLISLPPQFGHFEVTYNCQKNKWNINELISHVTQEEDRLTQFKTESAHLASTSSHGTKRIGKEIAVASNKKTKESSDDHKVKKCFFCKYLTHMKYDCPKYHAWHAKKGLPELSKTQ